MNIIIIASVAESINVIKLPMHYKTPIGKSQTNTGRSAVESSYQTISGRSAVKSYTRTS